MKKVFLLSLILFNFSLSIFAEGEVDTFDAMYERAMTSYSDKNYSSAAKEFEAALRLKPGNEQVQRRLLNVYYRCFESKSDMNNTRFMRFYIKKAEGLSCHEGLKNNKLSQMYFRYADIMCQMKRYSESAEMIDKAVCLDSQNGYFLKLAGYVYYHMAMEYFSERNYLFAEKQAEKALEYAEAKFDCYTLLGKIYYQQGQLDEALKMYMAARTEIKEGRAKGDKADLGAIIASINQEVLMLDNHKTSSGANFLIEYNNGISDRGRAFFEKELENAYRGIGRAFNYYPKTKVNVLVYSGEDFHKALGAGSRYIGALYDGKMRLPQVDADGSRGKYVPKHRFKIYVWHEYTHAIVHALSKNRCPKWFNEGLAENMEMKVTPNAKAYKKELPSKKYILSLTEINAWSFSFSDRFNTNLHYTQAYFMVKFLIDRYRVSRAKKMLEFMAEGLSFDDAFKAAYKITPESFYKKWYRSVS